jgi:ATP-binding cassette subfamily B protein
MRWEAARLARGAARVPAALLLTANLVSAALLVTYIYFSGAMLAAIPAAAHGGWGSPAGHDVAGYLAAAGGGFLATQVLSPVRVRLAALVTRQVDGVIRDRIAAASAAIPGLAPFEDQALIRELAMAREGLDSGNHTPGEAVAGLASLAGLYAQSVLAAVLLARRAVPGCRARPAGRGPAHPPGPPHRAGAADTGQGA